MAEQSLFHGHTFYSTPPWLESDAEEEEEQACQECGTTEQVEENEKDQWLCEDCLAALNNKKPSYDTMIAMADDKRDEIRDMRGDD